MRRVFVYCGDDLARCPFAKGGTVAEGLPVLTVDEEIYRLTPGVRDRHRRQVRPAGPRGRGGGAVRLRRPALRPPRLRPPRLRDVRHHDGAPGGQNGHPAATVQPVGRLRPPDLIIQDELHLITGALGTTVGLFEVAVETLSSWETARRQAGPAADRRVDRDRAQRPRPGPRPVRPAGRDLPAAGARRRRHLLLPGGADRPGQPGPPLPRGLRPRRAAVERRDPGRRGAAVGRAAAVRPGRRRRRPVHDARRLLQRHPRAGRHAPLPGRRRRRTASATRARTPASRAATAPPSATAQHRRADLADRVGRDRTHPGPARPGVRPGLRHDRGVPRAARGTERGQEGRRRATTSPFDVVLATSMLQVGVDVQRLG